MVWTKEKESFLLREVAAEGVLTHKLRSKERGTLWQTVAIKMNALGDELTSRSVRDHYNNMSKKYQARMAREERPTGEGGSKLTEQEQLLEDLIEIEEARVNEEGEKRQRIEKEKGQALEMRERAMERFGETKKRLGGGHEGEEGTKKRRRSSDMLEWLKGKIESERKEKEIERNNKKEELEIQRSQHTEMLQVLQQTQQQMSMQMKLSDQCIQQQVFQQQQQQEQQQQQMIAIMQQQTQLMANIFQNRE